MRGSVKTCVITGYGINADRELAEAFGRAGSKAERIHLNDLIKHPERLSEFRIIGFPGGFSFGDHLGSGLVFAGVFKRHLKDALDGFISSGGLVLGICNGFQVLVKMGVLPNFEGDSVPSVSLIHNKDGMFENSWVKVRAEKDSPCIWTKGVGEIDLPIRNGEGRFMAGSDSIYSRLVAENLVTLTYSERNPNGSQGDIAGITDPSGAILGLMPHPEAYLYPQNHPTWKQGDGLAFFRNGVMEAEKR